MKGYNLLTPQSSLLGAPDPTTDKKTELYQIIGDLERSARFYNAQYDEQSAEISLSNTYPTFSSMGGPQITIFAEAQHTFIILLLGCEIRHSNTTSSTHIGLKDSLEFSTSRDYGPWGGTPVFNIGSTVYERLVSSGPQLDRYPRGAWIVYPITILGEHDIEMTYSHEHAGTGFIRNRTLWGTAV